MTCFCYDRVFILITCVLINAAIDSLKLRSHHPWRHTVNVNVRKFAFRLHNQNFCVHTYLLTFLQSLSGTKHVGIERPFKVKPGQTLTSQRFGFSQDGGIMTFHSQNHLKTVHEGEIDN